MGDDSQHRRDDTLGRAQETYFDAVGQEALERAGNCPQLKGIVHEMLYRDKLNFGPNGLVQGNVTKLTRNPQAHGIDLVTTNCGRITGRYQLKDCSSPAGISDTLQRSRNGQYRSAKLVGTTETKRAYDAAKLSSDSKDMVSSGISSRRTGRIADNMGVNSRDVNLFSHNMADVASCAGNSAAMGAASAAVGSILANYERFRDGELDGMDYAAEVACDTARGAVSAAATTAAALTIKEGSKAIARSVGNQTMKRFAGGNVATGVAFGVVEVGSHAMELFNGEIDGEEFAKKTIGTTGATTGGLGGAAAGAALGSAVLPGVGTAIGAVIGGIAGSCGGRSICDAIADWLFD